MIYILSISKFDLETHEPIDCDNEITEIFDDVDLAKAFAERYFVLFHDHDGIDWNLQNFRKQGDMWGGVVRFYDKGFGCLVDVCEANINPDFNIRFKHKIQRKQTGKSKEVINDITP